VKIAQYYASMQDYEVREEDRGIRRRKKEKMSSSAWKEVQGCVLN